MESQRFSLMPTLEDDLFAMHQDIMMPTFESRTEGVQKEPVLPPTLDATATAESVVSEPYRFDTFVSESDIEHAPESKVLTHEEAVAMALKASGLQRSLSKGVRGAAKFAGDYLRNDLQGYRRPPNETLTMIDPESLIPHITVMSKLIALLAHIEDRPYDRQAREHWDAILIALKKIINDFEEHKIEDRTGDVMKQILRYIVPKLLLQKGIDLEETEFMQRRTNPTAQDWDKLIDYVIVVCQEATKECESLMKTQLKLGHNRKLEGAPTDDDDDSEEDEEAETDWTSSSKFTPGQWRQIV